MRSPRPEPAIDTGDLEGIPSRITELTPVRASARLESTISLQTSSAEPAELQPLFDAMQTRAIISRTLSQPKLTGPWNFRQVVEKCASGVAITALPRLPQASLASGVQLLVDRGEALMVFNQDQERLTKIIVRLAGEAKTQVLSFASFPSKAGTGGFFRWKPYDEQLPPPGTVVAVLTDFGIARPAWLPSPAPVSQWCDFALKLRDRQCPVVAFVPYAPQRWPEELKNYITLIHWDRSTGTSAVYAIIGKGLRVRASS